MGENRVNIKNLKINKRLVAMVLAVSNFTLVGCNLENKEVEETKTYYDITERLTVKDMYDINDIKLVYKDTSNEVMKDELLICYNDTLTNVDYPAFCVLDEEITSIYYNNKLVSRDDFTLVDKKTNKEIKELSLLMIDGIPYDFSEFKNNSEEEKGNDDDKEQDEEKSEEVSKITIDDAINTIKNYEKKLDRNGVNYNHEEVIRAYALINIDALSNEVNKDVFSELLSLSSSDSIDSLYGDVTIYNESGSIDHRANSNKVGYAELSNNIVNVNYPKFYNNGIAFSEILDLEDLIDDDKQADIYSDIKNRLIEMSYMLDTYELDSNVIILANDVRNGYENNSGTYKDITVGTLYALSPLFAELRGMVFMVCHEDDRALNNETEEAIAYLAPYSESEYICSFNSKMMNDARECLEQYEDIKTKKLK